MSAQETLEKVRSYEEMGVPSFEVNIGDRAIGPIGRVKFAGLNGSGRFLLALPLEPERIPSKHQEWLRNDMDSYADESILIAPEEIIFPTSIELLALMAE